MEAVRIVVRCAVWGESSCSSLLHLEQSKKTRSAIYKGKGGLAIKRRLTQKERGEVKKYWVSTASVDKSDASTGQTLIRLLDDDWNVDKNDKQRCKARIERENCSPVWVVSQLQGPGMPHVTHLNLHPSFHSAFGFVNSTRLMQRQWTWAVENYTRCTTSAAEFSKNFR